MKLIELLKVISYQVLIRNKSRVNTVVYKTRSGKICKVSTSTGDPLTLTVNDFLTNDWLVVDDWRGN